MVCFCLSASLHKDHVMIQDEKVKFTNVKPPTHLESPSQVIGILSRLPIV